jgi:hypothetical protein
VADIFKDARKKEYLNAEGADKPLKSPIGLDTVKRARAYRKRRIVEQLIRHDCAAIGLGLSHKDHEAEQLRAESCRHASWLAQGKRQGDLKFSERYRDRPRY